MPETAQTPTIPQEAAQKLLEACVAVHAPYKTLTEEALRDGVLMEWGPPKPDRGAAQILVRSAIALATMENPHD